MKKNCLLLLVAVVIVFGFSNCKYCQIQPISFINIQSYDTINDTHVQVGKYEKSGGFSKLVATSDAPLTVTPGSVFFGSATVDLKDAGYNYRLTLLPSGKIYDITDISYGHEKSGGNAGDHTKCSYGYKINGKQISNPSQQNDQGRADMSWIEIDSR